MKREANSEPVILSFNRKQAAAFARARGIRKFLYGNGELVEGCSARKIYLLPGWRTSNRALRAFEILSIKACGNDIEVIQ